MTGRGAGWCVGEDSSRRTLPPLRLGYGWGRGWGRGAGRGFGGGWRGGWGGGLRSGRGGARWGWADTTDYPLRDDLPPVTGADPMAGSREQEADRIRNEAAWLEDRLRLLRRRLDELEQERPDQRSGGQEGSDPGRE